MRKKLAGALAAVVATGAAAVALVAVNTGGAQAAASEPYTWKNVRIDGGGFVPGIIFNQTEQNLIYARTDIGGAYRWNQSTQSWTPLLDWVGWNSWGWNGVLSLATDPVQTNRVYAAVGMYTQRLGSQQRRDPALDRQGRDLAGDRVAVQGRRQHARPWSGRAARGRPEQQRDRLLRRRGRQRPVEAAPTSVRPGPR